jgi:hypothetical protein
MREHPKLVVAPHWNPMLELAPLQRQSRLVHVVNGSSDPPADASSDDERDPLGDYEENQKDIDGLQ